jgi:short-subunit dehydrogenase
MLSAQSIIITGASSGIGAALALEYAKEGCKLFLQGRDEKRLGEIALLCREKKAEVETKVIDVRSEADMKRWLTDIIIKHKVDLIIANAGISAGTAAGLEPDEQIRKIFSVNLDGVLNSILPLIPCFKEEKRGQIAIMSSLAGFRGLPSCPAYSASKAAVKAYGEALRGLLAKDNIAVNVITPGYIKTPLTDANKFPMPFIMPSQQAAKIIIRGLERNLPRIAFPLALYFVVWFLSCLSPRLTDFIYSRLPGK